MSAPQSTPPGWYPDPQAPGTERWWDGSQWGPQTRPLIGGPQATFTPGGAPGTPLASGTMAPSEVRSWSILAHVSALLTALIGFAFAGPLVVYLLKRDEDPTVRAHAAASLNFQLSWLIWAIGLSIVTVVLSLILIGLLLIPVLIAGAIAWLVLTILGAVRAADGQLYNYPLTIQFVN